MVVVVVVFGADDVLFCSVSTLLRLMIQGTSAKCMYYLYIYEWQAVAPVCWEAYFIRKHNLNIWTTFLRLLISPFSLVDGVLLCHSQYYCKWFYIYVHIYNGWMAITASELRTRLCMKLCDRERASASVQKRQRHTATRNKAIQKWFQAERTNELFC